MRSRWSDVRMWDSAPVRWSISAGALLAVGFVIGRIGSPAAIPTGIYVLATVVGARFFVAEAVEELIEGREIGIELLMTVATVIAGLLGEWGEAASLAFLYSISEALEEFTEDRTRAAIRKLLDLAPRQVTRLHGDGQEEEVELDDLVVGDRFLVRPGQNVATDGGRRGGAHRGRRGRRDRGVVTGREGSRRPGVRRDVQRPWSAGGPDDRDCGGQHTGQGRRTGQRSAGAQGSQ